MIPLLRQSFNQQFSPDRHQQYQREVSRIFNLSPQFKLLETPVFLPTNLTIQLQSACRSIISQLQAPTFRNESHRAIPPQWNVPDEATDPVFLQFDFAITLDNNGQISPQLIELQGFPALFFFQIAAFKGFESIYDLGQTTPYYDGLHLENYINLLKKTILANHAPEEVILLEYDPWNQKTALDFAGAKKLLGIPIIDIQDIEYKNKNLFYTNKKNKKIKIKRIFNRVILDELDQKIKHPIPFNLRQKINAEWVDHPNWFLKYSKFALPFIHGDFAPHSVFLHQWAGSPHSLKNYVLKPIFSFSGNGVQLNPTQHSIQNIKNKNQFILQQKITYAPILPSPQKQLSQVEVRVMLIQNPNKKSEYQFMTNLVRAGRQGIMGTQHQSNQNWTGGGIALML